MTEYQSTHQRVFHQVELYESTNIRILTLIGVLLYFGISNFGNVGDRYIHTMVNLLFVVVLPFIAVASVAFTGANLVKVMILGDFLKRIENRVNAVLKSEAKRHGFEKDQILSWEYWRVEHGYARGAKSLSQVTFSAFLVVAFIAASIAAVALRLGFILERNPVAYSAYLNASIAMACLFCLVTGYSFVCVSDQRKKSTQAAYKDDAV